MLFRSADRIVGLLEASGFEPPKLIINRIRPDMVKRGDMMNIEDMIDVLAIELAGVVPADEKIVVSTNRGVPAVVDELSKAGQAYRNIIRRFEGEEIPLMDLEDIEPTFMDKLRIFFGLKART